MFLIKKGKDSTPGFFVSFRRELLSRFWGAVRAAGCAGAGAWGQGCSSRGQCLGGTSPEPRAKASVQHRWACRCPGVAVLSSVGFSCWRKLILLGHCPGCGLGGRVRDRGGCVGDIPCTGPPCPCSAATRGRTLPEKWVKPQPAPAVGCGDTSGGRWCVCGALGWSQ